MIPRVDFAALVKPVRFGQSAADQAQQLQAEPEAPAVKGPAGFLSRTNRRRMACIKEAREALDLIPADGETLHAVMTGTYDLMHLLIVLLERLGSPCLTMRIATLSLSARNVTEMATLLDAGKVGRLDLLCSDFFRRHDAAIFAVLLLELGTRAQRVAAARSHAKVVTIALADGRRFTLEGSANLRTNKNQEQFALTQDAQLHAWYDSWIDGMVSTYEVHASDESGPGPGPESGPDSATGGNDPGEAG